MEAIDLLIEAQERGLIGNEIPKPKPPVPRRGKKAAKAKREKAKQ